MAKISRHHFQSIFMKHIWSIFMLISLNFVPKDPIDNKSALV